MSYQPLIQNYFHHIGKICKISKAFRSKFNCNLFYNIFNFNCVRPSSCRRQRRRQ